MLIATLAFVGVVAFLYLCYDITEEEAEIVDKRIDKIVEAARFIWVYLSTLLLVIVSLTFIGILALMFSEYTEPLNLNFIYGLPVGILYFVVRDHFKTQRFIHRIRYEEGFLEALEAELEEDKAKAEQQHSPALIPEKDL